MLPLLVNDSEILTGGAKDYRDLSRWNIFSNVTDSLVVNQSAHHNYQNDIFDVLLPPL